MLNRSMNQSEDHISMLYTRCMFSIGIGPSEETPPAGIA